MDNKKYMAVTIGPIFETINMSPSPAALWASSYLFSLVTKEICERLCSVDLDEKYKIVETDIVSPFFSHNSYEKQKNGIGLFPDRIIFQLNENSELNASNFKEKVSDVAVQSVAQKLGLTDNEDIKYLNEYIMIRTVVFFAKNPIVEASKYLDSIELASPYVLSTRGNHVIASLCEKEHVKNSELVKSFDKFSLRKESGNEKIIFKELKDIIGFETDTDFKKYSYYAIVRADGDGIGKLLEQIGTDSEKVNEFSKSCLLYCEKASELVSEYNGVTIYAGGDDLLAILPCDSKMKENEGTPFHFSGKLNAVFCETFKNLITECNKDKADRDKLSVSISVGITVAYYKFPLYEALEDSQNMLFGYAKRKRNGIAVKIQKHSGQSEGLFIPFEKLDVMLALMNYIFDNVNDDVILSALHKMSFYEIMFSNAQDCRTVRNLFVNIFDGFDHKNNEFLHQKLPDIFCDIFNIPAIKRKVCAIDDTGINNKDNAKTFSYLLRIIKFFVEKGGNNNG